jgi:hypothetical protein
MTCSIRIIVGALLCVGTIGFAGADFQSAHAAPPPQCKKFHIDVKASRPLANVTLPPQRTCVPRMKGDLPLPDPDCTPGAVNPTLTLDVLKTKGFTTKCVRNQATSAAEKRKTYAWYKIKPPTNNKGATMTCELDHVISLQLGGADVLENLWPQCGPKGVKLPRRYFKQKDVVENYLAREIKAGRITLSDAQKGIATDWTQYLAAARGQ